MDRYNEEKIKWLGNMMHHVGNVFYIVLDENYEMKYNNIPDLEIFHMIDVLNHGMDLGESNMPDITAMDTRGIVYPVIFSNSLGMSYITMLDKMDEQSALVHTIGPVFLDDDTPMRLMQRLNHIELSVATRKHFSQLLQLFPIMSLDNFLQWGMQLYYNITGRRLSPDGFIYSDLSAANVSLPPEASYQYEFHRERYLEENRLMEVIRTGNTLYQKDVTNLFHLKKSGRLSNEYLRQMKNHALILATLESRASMEGGISPEIALTLREQQILAIEAAGSLAELNRIHDDYVHEYIVHVHRMTNDGAISPEIKDTCQYIQLHPDKLLTIRSLAQRLSYSDYYFSTRFRTEVGETVNAYINRIRVEASCKLLTSHYDDIYTIALQCGFHSLGTFEKQFKKYKGMSPGAYRRNHK